MTNDFQYKPQSPKYSGSSPSSNRTRNLLILLAIIGSLSLLVCCGGMLLLVQTGASVIEAELQEQLSEHPRIQEHVGELTKVEHNWAKSLNEEDYDIWFYDIEGTEGEAELKLRTTTDEDGAEVILGGSLIDKKGEVIQLEF